MSRRKFHVLIAQQIVIRNRPAGCFINRDGDEIARRARIEIRGEKAGGLVRRQADGSFAREAVDFESLFQRGELQHNKLLAPDDYMYFPPTGLEEVYVLGEVRGIGPLPYTRDLSVLGAIAGCATLSS